jgi:hypothetical protein
MQQNIKTFQIKQNDTLPALQVNIKTRDSLDSVIPFDLSAVTACTFSMIDSSGNFKISAMTAATNSSSGGTIQYNWVDGDTDTDGKYKAEFKLYFSGGTGTKITLPTFGVIEVNILKDINGI